jgi:hypothetical protein
MYYGNKVMCSFKIVDIRHQSINIYIYIYKESTAEHHSQISSLSLAALQIKYASTKSLGTKKHLSNINLKQQPKNKAQDKNLSISSTPLHNLGLALLDLTPKPLIT